MNAPGPLPAFSGEKTTCVKCGCDDAATQWLHDITGPEFRFLPADRRRLTGREHLERTCCRCSYRWAEAVV